MAGVEVDPMVVDVGGSGLQPGLVARCKYVFCTALVILALP